GRTDVAGTDRLDLAAVATAQALDPLRGGAGHRHAGHVEPGARGGGRRLGRHRRLLTARPAPLVGVVSGTRCGASGPEMGRPFAAKGLRGVPYLAGLDLPGVGTLPASPPVGCRGFNGPVPPPLLIR